MFASHINLSPELANKPLKLSLMELVPSLWGVYAGAALLSTTVVAALYKSVAYSTGFLQGVRDVKQMTSTV